MVRSFGSLAIAVLAGLAGSAMAQPTITSLGSGGPLSVSNNIGGSYYVGGSGINSTAAARWTVTAGGITSQEISGTVGSGWMSADGTHLTALVTNSNPRIFGNTASNVSPPFSTTPTLVTSTTNPAATELCAAEYDFGASTLNRLGGLPIVPSLMVYGSGSSGSSTGTFETPNAVSANGRYVVGLGYISSYSAAAGTAISDNTFTWRAWIYDNQAGTFTVLPTPFRTTSSTWKHRTANPYAVSSDGTVIVGAQEHNASTSPGADPDGGRPVVWRWDGSSTYVMSFLPNGTNASGQYYTYSTTPGSFAMNQAGTIIVGRAADSSGNLYIAKWVWNADTSSWNAPINLGSNLTTPASWLPIAVTSCGQPPALGANIAMSDDGNVVVGQAVYSTCGSFMSGGFIWTPNDGGVMQDWYDYLASQNTPGVTTNGFYGPTGDNGDMTKGLPVLGYPTAVSPDGSAVVGLQGGTQRIPNAPPWIVQLSGGTSCVPPSIALNPANVTFARCSSGSTVSLVALAASAAGTAPMTYQWYMGSTALSDGLQATGSTVTGSTSFQMRITSPMPADSGQYHCVITGCNGATATSNNATVQNDPTVPTTGDTCATAIACGEGVTNFNICGCYLNDGFFQCQALSEAADIWFRYTPTFTGNARFQTCNGSSFWDSTLEAYDSCGGTMLACNNDVGARGLAGVGTSCGSTKSVISRMPVTAGVPVLVRVGGLTSLSSTGSITISQAPNPPANDLCANATPVSIGGPYPFDLAEATDDYTYGVDICSGGTATASNRDVWFKLISPWGGTYTISTCGSTITNPMLHVIGDCSNGFGILACNDNVGSGVAGCTSNQARISNLVVTGNVLIRVSQSGTGSPGTAATSGQGILTITGTANRGCGSADFNCDGAVGTDADIEAFFACMSGNCPAFPCMSTADFDGDGATGTDADIEAFFRVLGGMPC
jgi:hypothetical protein